MDNENLNKEEVIKEITTQNEEQEPIPKEETQQETITSSTTQEHETEEMVKQILYERKPKEEHLKLRAFIAGALFIAGAVLFYKYNNIKGLYLIIAAFIFCLINYKYKRKVPTLTIVSLFSILIVLNYGVKYYIVKQATKDLVETGKKYTWVYCKNRYEEVARIYVENLDIKPEGKTSFNKNDCRRFYSRRVCFGSFNDSKVF